jgi:hypothetical protein
MPPNRLTAARRRAAYALTAGAVALAFGGTSTAYASTSQASATAVQPGPGCTPAQLVANPGFENGSASWTGATKVVATTGAGEVAHTGTHYAWLDGFGTTHTDQISQTITISPLCKAATLSFWMHIDTAETTTTSAFDKLQLQIVSSTGTTVMTTWSNLNHGFGYSQHNFSLMPWLGKTITVKFVGTEDAAFQTSFVIDDVTVPVD